MVIMWPLSLGDLQQSKVLVLHPRPRVTLLLHHNPYPQPVVYWHPISWSLIPHPPKVNNSTPPLQLGPHPTPREFNMPVQGGGGSLGTMNQDCGDGHIAPRLAQLSDLQTRGCATRTPTTQEHNDAASSGGGGPLCSALVPDTCKPGQCPDHTLSLRSGLSTGD